MEPQYQEYEELSFWSGLRDKVIELIEFIAIVLAILIVIRFFIAEPHKVSGHSMVPNFQDGDYIITNKLATHLDKPQRGEVIILQNPRNPDQVFIKRIIALSGERVALIDGKVYVNNQPLTETYLPPGTITQGESFIIDNENITIPNNQYFVLGDNRVNSSDSREFGPIKKEFIIGGAWLRYWPINKFTLIRTNIPST